MNATFDTLSASKRLRDAGVEERTAEAIVELVQSAARMPDISDLATKSDLDQFARATKSDLDQLAKATKSDFDQLARVTKSDLDQFAMATKNDFDQLARVTKSDLDQFAMATKRDLDQLASQMATKSELQSEVHALRLELKGDIAALETRFSEKLRVQGWALMGGMAALITIYTALIKLLP